MREPIRIKAAWPSRRERGLRKGPSSKALHKVSDRYRRLPRGKVDKVVVYSRSQVGEVGAVADDMREAAGRVRKETTS